MIDQVSPFLSFSLNSEEIFELFELTSLVSRNSKIFDFCVSPLYNSWMWSQIVPYMTLLNINPCHFRILLMEASVMWMIFQILVASPAYDWKSHFMIFSLKDASYSYESCKNDSVFKETVYSKSLLFKETHFFHFWRACFWVQIPRFKDTVNLRICVFISVVKMYL